MARRRSRKGACCAGQDIHDARRVAAAIGIPHYVLDYESASARAVIAAFRRELCGRARRRCRASRCNQTVKFTDLLETARDLAADALATGHYVASRRRSRRLGAARAPPTPTRDQSYFLFAHHARAARLPALSAGRPGKEETRQLAPNSALPSPTSRTVRISASCRRAAMPTRRQAAARRGGARRHRASGRAGARPACGIIHFTVGQRRGLGIAYGEPLFVVRLDAARRLVFVARARL